MSIYKRLWLPCIVMTLAGVVGGVFVLLTMGKIFLQGQLAQQNAASARYLAEQIKTQSSRGGIELHSIVKPGQAQYRLLLVQGAGGEELFRFYSNVGAAAGLPKWFIHAIDLAVAEETVPIVVDDVTIGSVTVATDDSRAYRFLWFGSLYLSLFLLVLAVLSSSAVFLLVRKILTPLQDITRQAKAIEERRFLQVETPAITEFQSLSQTMNSLSERIRQLFFDNTSRLRQQQVEMQKDQLTGLYSRPNILAIINSFLNRDDEYSSGNVVLVRITQLHELNVTYGRELMDHLIRLLGLVIYDMFDQRKEDIYAGRLDGGDFLLLVPIQQDVKQWCDTILSKLRRLAREQSLPNNIVCMVSTNYVVGETVEDVVQRLEKGFAEGIHSADNGGYFHVHNQSQLLDNSESYWEQLLHSSFADNQFILGHYAVIDKQHNIMHYEAPIRIKLQEQELRAGYFLGWVHRLSKFAELDIRALTLAIQTLDENPGHPGIGININANTFSNHEAREKYLTLVKQAGVLIDKMWFEVAEATVYHYLDDFREFAHAVKDCGGRVGLEHAGHHIEKLGQLHDIGLDYIKIDSSFTLKVYKQPASQVFLQGIVAMAQAINLKVIAEGVQTQQDRACLLRLGFEGVTGPVCQQMTTL